MRVYIIRLKRVKAVISQHNILDLEQELFANSLETAVTSALRTATIRSSCFPIMRYLDYLDLSEIHRV